MMPRYIRRILSLQYEVAVDVPAIIRSVTLEARFVVVPVAIKCVATHSRAAWRARRSTKRLNRTCEVIGRLRGGGVQLYSANNWHYIASKKNQPISSKVLLSLIAIWPTSTMTQQSWVRG